MPKNVRAIILAAGKSTRFKTDKSKLIHTVCGQPMILYPIKLLQELNIKTTLVLGYQAEDIKKTVSEAKLKKVDYVIQKKQKGTGDAVLCSQKTWDTETILILNGDTPLLTKNLIAKLIEKHKKEKATLSFLTTHALNPDGYGRIVKEDNKIKIVEEKNCDKDQVFISNINAGIYLIEKEFLKNSISQLKQNSVSGEVYITDLVEFASKQDLKVINVPVPYDEIRGVNNLQELWAAEQIKRSELMRNWMERGVRFELAQSTHLDFDIEIGKNSFIGTGAHILSGTKIGEGCTVNAFTIINNSTVGDNSIIHSHSVIQDSTIGKNADIGPFARLRGNNILKENVSIGNFVEVKNSKIDKGSKAKHLTYLGDAQIGKSVNIGAGTITCNYDGKKKHVTKIEDNSFIGSNNALIAPVKIGKNSFTAAGSTINKDVPEGSLAFARSKQTNKVGYFSKAKKQSIKSKNKGQVSFIGATKPKDNQETV